MNAIILCGGLSTRLGEITKATPKILLEIGGRTVLDWQLEKIKKLGINEVILAAGHLSQVLLDTVGQERNGVKLIYAIEEKKLGTGGAIKHGINHINNFNDVVIILNGDVLTTVDLNEMVNFLPPESEGVILGSYVEDVASYGTLIYDQNYLLKEFKEKEGINRPGFQNGGVYLFNPAVSKYFPNEDEFSIEYDVFPRMKNLYVYESNHPWIDVGLPERLLWAKENWKKIEEKNIEIG